MATKIFIDQGHNPVNPNAGAEGNGYREQDLVFEIGRRLAAILEANGFETRLSRPTSTTQLGTSVATSLAERVNNANTWGADYFVSLHTNASVNPQANGAEVLVYSTSSPAFELAQSVLEQLTLSTGLRGRGVVARPGLYVLRRTAMPAILVEMGFITNPQNANLMANSPELFARGIANGIIDYVRRSVPSSAVPYEIPTFNTEIDTETPTPRVPPNEIGDTEDIPNDGSENDSDELQNNSGSVKPEYDSERYESIEEFMGENNREGQLKIQAFRGEQALPLSGVSIMITKPIGGYDYIFFEGDTNDSGIIDGIKLPAPPKENSTEFGKRDSTALYLLTATKDRYDTIERQIEIFSDIKTIQPLQMTQRRGGIYGTPDNT
ncbi:MAG: N-acetylmuramoyl-L-alanine amidase [Clostridia bacterium]|nr:N-acetylmuramoyl-L-alanine amidase [Clostridia bacterium]